MVRFVSGVLLCLNGYAFAEPPTSTIESAKLDRSVTIEPNSSMEWSVRTGRSFEPTEIGFDSADARFDVQLRLVSTGATVFKVTNPTTGPVQFQVFKDYRSLHFENRGSESHPLRIEGVLNIKDLNVLNLKGIVASGNFVVESQFESQSHSMYSADLITGRGNLSFRNLNFSSGFRAATRGEGNINLANIAARVITIQSKNQARIVTEGTEGDLKIIAGDIMNSNKELIDNSATLDIRKHNGTLNLVGGERVDIRDQSNGQIRALAYGEVFTENIDPNYLRPNNPLAGKHVLSSMRRYRENPKLCSGLELRKIIESFSL